MSDALRNILEHQTTAVILLDAALTIGYVNPAAQALLGVSEQTTAGRPLDQFCTDPTTASSTFAEGLETGQTLTSRGATLTLRNGESLLVDYTITPLMQSAELLLELQTINRLVRINRDDQSTQAQEASRKLLSGLAHEVKNPLGGIRGAAQLLQREFRRDDFQTGSLLDPDSLSEYTQIIIDETDRLTNLVDRILGPTKALTLVDENIHRLLERVVSLLEVEFGAVHDATGGSGPLTINRDYDPSLPDFKMSEEPMVQALLNIARNACQAMECTGTPTITLRTRIVRQFTIGTTRHRLVAQIDIEDNGAGIPEEIFDRIFYPMISGRNEGTGLGLSITQSIVGQHGGLLECTSQPGKTTFSIFLPICPTK